MGGGEGGGGDWGEFELGEFERALQGGQNQLGE